VQVSTSPSTDGGLIPLERADDLAGLFRLLGDPTRVRIVDALLAHDEMCVCDVAAAVGTTETKVSQAMRLLRSARVVRNRRDGRNVYYRLDDDHVRTLLQVSHDHVTHHREGR
jgi:DNA-binding transcriptional ArsR family regulator